MRPQGPLRRQGLLRSRDFVVCARAIEANLVLVRLHSRERPRIEYRFHCAAEVWSVDRAISCQRLVSGHWGYKMQAKKCPGVVPGH